MTRPTVMPANGITILVVERANSSLQVIGAQSPEITIRCSDDPLDTRLQNGQLTLSAEDDLILYLPSTIALEVRRVEGDVDVRAFSGPLSFKTVSGDLQIRNAANVNVFKVEGDLMIKNCTGNVSVAACDGDAVFKDISGNISLKTDGDLNLTDCDANLSAKCEGDLFLNLERVNGNIACQASGDAILQLPENVNARFSLESNSPDEIRVDLPGVRLESFGNPSVFTLGDGTHLISIQTEGSLLITGPNRGKSGGWGVQDLSGLESTINNFVDQTVESALRSIPRVEIDEAKINAKIHKVEDAMRKVEDKIRAAERRARHMGWQSNPGGVSRAATEPPVQPVSAEEQMAVLRLLQEKKITIEEAETLLAALEGKSNDQ